MVEGKSMDIPQGHVSEEHRAAAEEMRRRVEQLWDTDNSYEDSVYDLAVFEDQKRDKLLQSGMPIPAIAEYADDHSTTKLENLEIKKERWLDKMTGLRNKNAFMDEVKQFLAYEKRLGQESSFLMLDFDHFKSVNDLYGHKAGDEALKQIAQIMKKEVRTSDAVYRYGGEEFIIYLPNTVSIQALVLAERIRNAVEQADITVTDQEGKSVVIKKTISIGCVGTDQIDAKNVEIDDLLISTYANSADRALYASKNSGRNRVTLYSEDLEEKNIGKKKN